MNVNLKHEIHLKSTPTVALLALSLASLLGPAEITARADAVTDWNENLFKAAKAAAQLPAVEARSAAMVQVAVFDAVNGIVRKYQPYFVTDSAPPGARPEAASVQAALLC
jgi:hypothetical protein